jgi:hypothetical protein
MAAASCSVGSRVAFENVGCCDLPSRGVVGAGCLPFELVVVMRG